MSKVIKVNGIPTLNKDSIANNIYRETFLDPVLEEKPAGELKPYHVMAVYYYRHKVQASKYAAVNEALCKASRKREEFIVLDQRGQLVQEVEVKDKYLILHFGFMVLNTVSNYKTLIAFAKEMRSTKVHEMHEIVERYK